MTKFHTRSLSELGPVFGLFSVATLAVSTLTIPPVNAEKSGQLPQTDTTRAAIGTILSSPGRLPYHLERYRKVLTKYYIDGAASTYWIHSPTHVTKFVQRMMLADDDGLKPSDYPADYLLNLRGSVDPSDPVAAAFTELTFTSFFIKYATDLRTGRFIPQKIDPDLFQPKGRINKSRLLASLSRSGSPNTVLDRIAPPNRHYRVLKPALAKYRHIVDLGGWKQVPFGPTLKPGMSDPRMPLIRARLELTGDLSKSAGAGEDPNLYSNAIAKGVKRFQRRVGLNDEGIIGKLSLIQMNISAKERLRQIVVNMERWRWMPQNMGNTHIMVNIAAFELYRVKNNKVIETKNVVVGQKFHQTPVFFDKMKYVVLNPNWTLPYSIATNELLPKLQKDPNYLKADFEVLRGGKPVDPYSIDWTQYSKNGFPFVFRQRPGPTNALGQVKFIFPNKHAIYLHDTPSKSLFTRRSRAFSHGCIRVHKPIGLAEHILAQVPGWTPQRILATLASRKLTRVNLVKPIPIHLVYATVWAGKNGTVNFRPDIYGRDRKLYRALFGKYTS